MLGVGVRGPLGRLAAIPDDGDDGAPAAGGPPPGRTAIPLDPERAALAILATVDGVGPLTLGRLVGSVGSARRVLAAALEPGAAARLVEASRGPDADGRPMQRDVAEAIARAAADGQATIEAVRRAGLSVLTPHDPEYPARLRAIELPPPILFVHGSLAALAASRSVAVVGTRRPTFVGRRLAARIGTALARLRVVVVSGLAVGIDGEAHAAVVGERGATVAVLGGGHERLYPAAHRRLAAAIVATGGAVVSELPPTVHPTPGTFPRRNRVIAALAEATVVVEAGRSSGALITAAWALEQGRGCFVVPGALDAPASAGCLAFLRECPGVARIVAGVPELLVDLGLVEVDDDGVRRAGQEPLTEADAHLVEVGPVARQVAKLLVGGAATVDELVGAAELPVATVLAALTILEGRGLAVGAYGRYRPAGSLVGATPGRYRVDRRDERGR